MTRVATSIGLAFVNAAASSLSSGKAPWTAKRVAHNVEHTKLGTKEQRGVVVHCTNKTARSIMERQHVDVRS